MTGPPARSRARPFLLLAATALLVAGFFLGVYFAFGYRVPIGFDVARYLDQTNAVARYGLVETAALRLPAPGLAFDSRVGFPVLVLSLSRVTGTSTFVWAAALPAAAAAATALAAGALLTSAARGRPWEAAAAAALVGVSPGVARMMAGTYTDNLLAAALVVAAIAMALVAVRGAGGIVAPTALLAAAGIAHPAFFAVGLTVLAVTALVALPASWRAWRRGTRPWRTPAARLALIVGLAGALAAVVVFVLLRTSVDRPVIQTPRLFRARLRQDLPLYLLPVTVPAALAGAWWLARRERRANDRAPRAPLTVACAAWAALTLLAAATLLSRVRSVPGQQVITVIRALPAHRFLAFLVPLPLLAGAALVGAGRALSGRARGGRALAAVAVAAGLAGAVALGGVILYRTLADRGLVWMDPDKVAGAARAGAYLDAAGVPAGRPVIFVVDDRGPDPGSLVSLMAHTIRAVQGTDRLPAVNVFVGRPDDLQAGRPTRIEEDDRGYNKVSNRQFRSVRRVLDEDPVILMLEAFHPDYPAAAAADPGAVVAPGVLSLAGGGRASAAPPDVPSVPTGALPLGALGAGSLVLLGLAGAGWAFAGGGLRAFEAAALAPAFGLAAVLFTGIVLDVAGLRLGRAGGAIAVPVAALLGLAVWFRRRGPDGS